MNIANIPSVITTACILHNICKICGEIFHNSWLREIKDASFFPANLKPGMQTTIKAGRQWCTTLVIMVKCILVINYSNEEFSSHVLIKCKDK